MKNKNKLKNYLKTDIKYEPIKQERQPYYMHSVEKYEFDPIINIWAFLAVMGILAVFFVCGFLAIYLLKGGVQ